jgi:Activator of Hsp90 ATPase homolog 1-like protein
MLAFDPPLLLEFTWGPDRLRIELEPDGKETQMTFTVVLDQLGKATRDGAGWHQSLHGLDRVLGGDRTRDYKPDQWRSLRDAYAEQFGTEASVLGPPQEWEDKYHTP